MRVPPMVPSAVIRLTTAEKAAMKQWDDEQHNKLWPAPSNPYETRHRINAIEVAHRDGYAAGFSACLGMLREPSDELAAITARAIGECIAAQFRLEKVGEGDKQRAYFTLPGRALDFSAASNDALHAATTALADIAEIKIAEPNK